MAKGFIMFFQNVAGCECLIVWLLVTVHTMNFCVLLKARGNFSSGTCRPYISLYLTK